MKITIIAAGLILLTASATHAQIETIPSSLTPGDEYRLAFVTSQRTVADTDVISFYDDFVQDAADAELELAALGATWKAVVSSATEHASINTGTAPILGVGVPIFLLNDTKLVDNNADLWDGTVDTPLNITESGASKGAFVWTGTSPTGFAGLFPVGGDSVDRGSTFVSDSGWVNITNEGDPFFPLSLYSISSVLVAPQPGDYDGDFDVDGDDFLILQVGLGIIYDAADLLEWETNFGATPLGATFGQIPEPTTCGLVLTATLFFAVGKRRVC